MTEQDTLRIISNLVQKSFENNIDLSKYTYQLIPSAYIFITETQPIESKHLNYPENNEMQWLFKPILLQETNKSAQ